MLLNDGFCNITDVYIKKTVLTFVIDFSFWFPIFKTRLQELEIIKAVFNFFFSFVQARYIGKKTTVTEAK